MPPQRFTLAAVVLLSTVLLAQGPKKKITRAADVPVFQYLVSSKVEDLIQSDAAFQPLAKKIRADVESVLRDYEIEDASTHRAVLSTLVALDILDGRDEQARKELAEMKPLEEKPAQKAMSGLITRRDSGCT